MNRRQFLGASSLLVAPYSWATNITTYSVGTSGDFLTINDGLEFAINNFPTQIGTTVEFVLLSGFVMREQVYIDGTDLSWCRIKSEDAEVTIDRSALTRQWPGGWYPAFGVRNQGALPRIRTLFRMDTSGIADRRQGIRVTDGSFVEVGNFGGVMDAGSDGIFVRSARAMITGCNFSGAGGDGLMALQASTVAAANVDATNAAGNGVAVYSVSTVDVSNADLRSVGDNGVLASSAAYVNAHGANAYGSGTKGFFVWRGGIINAYLGKGSLSQSPNVNTEHGIIYADA